MSHPVRVAVVALAIALGSFGCIDPLLVPPPDAGPTTARDAGPRAVDAGQPWVPPAAGPYALRPPVAGGTMIVTADGSAAVIGDADIDALMLVALPDLTPVWRTSLPERSDPGRIVEDADGRFHVVLRHTGAIATVDRDGAILATRPVCAAPRGIAFRAADDALVIACAEGLLITLPAAGGAVTAAIAIADDLRDVVIAGDLLLVSRFRSAEILAIDAAGVIVSRWLPASHRTDIEGRPRIDFEPNVAWRMISDGAGGALVLHQRARTTPIALASPVRPGAVGGGYGGEGAACGGELLQVVVSRVHPTQPSGVLAPTSEVPSQLAVDLALSPERASLSFASGSSAVHAGGNIVPPGLVEIPFASIFEPTLSAQAACAMAVSRREARARATSVVYAPDGSRLLFSRTPSALQRIARTGLVTQVILEPSFAEPGHDVFHAVTRSGAACASCHPEGGDDGHVWRFDRAHDVRTQTLRGGIIDTAPFHWLGDLADLQALVDEVFTRRMGGQALSRTQVEQLGIYLHGMAAPARPAGSAAAIERGRALFDSSEVGCATCHSGARFTSGANADVGTGGSFQVPTLIGIAYRAPYLHTGCAPTLEARFQDPTCSGGERHGHTAHLEREQLADLVEYLRSL